MNLRVDTISNQIIGVEPRYDWPVTLGKMCPKGVTAYQQTNHDDRLLMPLIRDDASKKGTKDGFREASWNEAYELIARKFKELQVEYGKDTLSVFSGVSMTNEKCYLTGKFAFVALQTRYIDYNGRFCMSSAAAGFLSSFGVDSGSTLHWTDTHLTDCLFIAGSNTAECRPTSMFRVWEVRNRGGYLIVVDLRETPLARRADIHLNLKPGTDLALANCMVFVVPVVTAIGLFGVFGGDPQVIMKDGVSKQLRIQNAAFIWVIPIVLATVAAMVGMNSLATAKASIAEQVVIFKRKHSLSHLHYTKWSIQRISNIFNFITHRHSLYLSPYLMENLPK